MSQNPVATRLNQMSVVMEGTNHPEFVTALKIGAEEIQRLHNGLVKIQRSGNNAEPLPIWMQKVAAHAINPTWPEPGEQP